MSDLLERAAAALRERHDGASPDADATRDRILASAKRPLVITRRRARLVLPLAAALVVTTAWAGATGRLRHVRTMIDGAFGSAEYEPARANPVPTTPSATSPPPAPPPPPEPIPAEPTPTTKPVPVTPPIVTATTPSAPPPAASVPARTADDDYRAAHAAQFERKDYASALAGWDRYLAAAPNGAMSIEARYNRAIALVRLGRNAEARTALRPFADGEYGEYRRADAQSLLTMLDRRARDE